MSFLENIMARHRIRETPTTTPTDYDNDDSNAGRFEAFHRANPHVLEVLRDMALALKQRGFERVGMKALFEQLRWYYFIQTSGQGEYKLANTMTAYYARTVMAWCPQLEGMFDLRIQTAEPAGHYTPRWERLNLTKGGGSVEKPTVDTWQGVGKEISLG